MGFDWEAQLALYPHAQPETRIRFVVFQERLIVIGLETAESLPDYQISHGGLGIAKLGHALHSPPTQPGAPPGDFSIS